MDYYKSASLPCWKQLQSFCHSRWNGEFTLAKVYSGPEFVHIRNLVTADIKQSYQLDIKVKHAILFINPGNFIQDLHVDGFEIGRVGASNTALNIPILNCDQGYMYWYTGQYTLSKHLTDTLKYLKITWDGEPIIADSALIDKPTFVKIDTPHNIENKSNDPRLMLSIRFENDIPLDSIR